MDPLSIVFGVILLAVCLAPLLVRADLFHLSMAAGLGVLCAVLFLFVGRPFAMCLALGPVAIYLLLLGAINLGGRPFLVSGTRDTAALALAAVGLVMIGPMELFFPMVASIHLGAYVWLLLAALYALSVVLLVLLSRPRLVVYNISMDELRPVLAEVVRKLDPDARWAQDSLALPNLGVQLHIESLAIMRNVSLVSGGPAQNPQGWRRLELALAAGLAPVEVPRNVHAVGLISAGLAIVLFLVLAVSRDPQAVAQTLFDVLQL